MGIFKSARMMVDKHYDAMAKVDCNTCNVGTWAIKRNDVLCKGSISSCMGNLLRILGIGSHEAPTSTPVSTFAEKTVIQSGGGKILVLCKGPAFSEGLVADTLRMAAKAGMSIVALNLYEHGNEFPEFQRQAKSNIEGFQRKAQAAGLDFTQMVAKGPEALTMTRLLASGFRFRHLMVDTTRPAAARSAAPVYTRATLRAE